MLRRLAVGLSVATLSMLALYVPAPASVQAAGVCTGWTSEYSPPTHISVYRTLGPSRGSVQQVPFSTYVQTVLANEFGANTPIEALKAGAIAVKQYGWYYAMHWRGGSARGHCFDVVDNTSDQLFYPERSRASSRALQAVSATWPVSLRKGGRLFLTQYDGGRAGMACGAVTNGWRLDQLGAYTCAENGKTVWEILRTYYYPSLEFVVPGAHDVTGSGLGDVTALTVAPAPSPQPGPIVPAVAPVPASLPAAPAASWMTPRIYPAISSWTAAAVSGSESASPIVLDPSSTVAVASADVNGDRLADLIVLRRDPAGDLVVDVSLASPAGFQAPSPWWSSADSMFPVTPTATIRLVAGDFDGDGLADVGLLVGEPGMPPADGSAPTATQSLFFVLRSSGTAFAAPQPWGTFPVDASRARAFAADVNGDGRADLVLQTELWGVPQVPDPVGQAQPAPQAPSLAQIGTRFLVATARAGGGLTDALVWLDLREVTLDQTKTVVADLSRDGRQDLVVDVPTATGGSEFLGLVPTGTAFTRTTLWRNPTSFLWSASKLESADVNGDGRGDVVVLYDLGPSGTMLASFLSTGTSLVPGARTVDATLAWSTAQPF